MARYLMPPDFPLHMAEEKQLVCRQGKIVPSSPGMFPDFFAKSHEVEEQVFGMTPLDEQDPIQTVPSYNATRYPLQPTDEGFVFDANWAVFGTFFENRTVKKKDLPHVRLLEDLSCGKIDWKIKCPVVHDYESLIGQLIDRYGSFVGGNPDYPGMNARSEQVRYPISEMLKSAPDKELISFDDRGRSLLDLAVSSQQWDLAEHLWRRGVRWSDEYLASGIPLEALVVASLQLQNTIKLPINDALPPDSSEAERLSWLSTWQERFVSCGGCVDAAPRLGWRSRLAHMRNWDLGKDIADTPASFWISRITTPLNTGLPPLGRVPSHVSAIASSWAVFFTSHGIDLHNTPVTRGPNREDAVGFEEFWANSATSQDWIDLINSSIAKHRLGNIANRKSSAPSSSVPKI